MDVASTDGSKGTEVGTGPGSATVSCCVAKELSAAEVTIPVPMAADVVDRIDSDCSTAVVGWPPEDGTAEACTTEDVPASDAAVAPALRLVSVVESTDAGPVCVAVGAAGVELGFAGVEGGDMLLLTVGMASVAPCNVVGGS